MVMRLTIIREVPGSISDIGRIILTECHRTFSSLFGRPLGCLKIGHDNFLPETYQSIIHIRST